MMSIRSTAKALIVRDGQLLLNRCSYPDGRIYYDLPGGGQHPFESLEDALRREIREETGYTATVQRMVAISEEINTDPALRATYPEYCHRILHIFLAELSHNKKEIPTEKDLGMDTSVWIPLEKVHELPEINPSYIQSSLQTILSASAPIWFGTEYRDRI